MSFAENLSKGFAGESLISKWLVQKNYFVLPAYEIIIDQGKGPRLLSPNGRPLICPDLMAIRGGAMLWIEAKTKTCWTLYRMNNTLQTGIDKRHWLDYVSVYEQMNVDVWLMFLHKPEANQNPSGLFGNTIEKLKVTWDHHSDRHGPSGMIYWQVDALKHIAQWSEISGQNLNN